MAEKTELLQAHDEVLRKTRERMLPSQLKHVQSELERIRGICAGLEADIASLRAEWESIRDAPH